MSFVSIDLPSSCVRESTSDKHKSTTQSVVDKTSRAKDDKPHQGTGSSMKESVKQAAAGMAKKR